MYVPLPYARRQVPSDDKVIELKLSGVLVENQVSPKLVEEKYCLPRAPKTISLAPSPEAVTPIQLPLGKSFDRHVAPPLVEV